MAEESGYAQSDPDKKPFWEEAGCALLVLAIGLSWAAVVLAYALADKWNG